MDSFSPIQIYLDVTLNERFPLLILTYYGEQQKIIKILVMIFYLLK